MPCKQLRHAACATVIVLMAACGRDQTPTGPSLSTEKARIPDGLPALVRQLAAGRGIGRMERPPYVRPALVRLGQALAFDKILSGNHDISCMTCHLPAFATGDDRSLSIGQGATGLGPTRVHASGAFIARNAPSLFNLTALKSLFWDGRVTVDQGGFHTPAGTDLTHDMTRVFEYGPVSALGLFPVENRAEMRGDAGNELALIPDADNQAIWRGLMKRLGGIAEYRRMFEEAYPGTRFDRMTFAHASNAIGGFLVDQFSFIESPWDRFLAGDDRAMTAGQLAGAQTFLTIRCSLCHNGPALTDNLFHNVALAQFGPGKGNGTTGTDDFGRMNITGLAVDQYRFRTTPLRNVELTGPYGHDGAFSQLRGFIDHYSDSEIKLRSFDVNGLEQLLRPTLVSNADAIMATRDTILSGVVLSETIIDQLTTFMSALTDPRARNLRSTVPGRVPSGLRVDRP